MIFMFWLTAGAKLLPFCFAGIPFYELFPTAYEKCSRQAEKVGKSCGEASEKNEPFGGAGE